MHRNMSFITFIREELVLLQVQEAATFRCSAVQEKKKKRTTFSPFSELN